MRTRAFTLIELMIVVAIIGILASIAIPNFVKFQCRSKQTEAKGSLKSIYVAEESFRAENDVYSGCGAPGSGSGVTVGANGSCAATNVLGFQPKGNKIRYNYEAAAASGPTFSATASAKSAFASEMKADTWTITDANDLLPGTTTATRGCD